MSDDRITKNVDGSATVKLTHEITLGKQRLSAVTVPQLRGRHIMTIPWRGGAKIPLGELITWANSVVLPLGAVEVMDVDDASLVAGVVVDAYVAATDVPAAPAA